MNRGFDGEIETSGLDRDRFVSRGFRNRSGTDAAKQLDMTILNLTELSTITGGAAAAASPSYDQFASDLKDSLRKKYTSFVCDGAGLQGGTTFADQVYGKGATGNDKIRATQMITKYCNDGTHLPAAAPAFPF
jgi:hypothetical protein